MEITRNYECEYNGIFSKSFNIAMYWVTTCLLLACLYWGLFFLLPKEDVLLGLDRFALAEQHSELSLLLSVWAFACTGFVGYILRIRPLMQTRVQRVDWVVFIVSGILLTACCYGEIMPPCELYFAQGFYGTLHQFGCAEAATTAPFFGFYVWLRPTKV
ncbi:MAG: hypothetical protein IJ864_03330 [Alphaproteobacteria bacterium]|nr:hypothetical protein [Alphaproteobacteria bacterium]